MRLFLKDNAVISNFSNNCWLVLPIEFNFEQIFHPQGWSVVAKLNEEKDAAIKQNQKLLGELVCSTRMLLLLMPLNFSLTRTENLSLYHHKISLRAESSAEFVLDICFAYSMDLNAVSSAHF